MAVNTRQRIGEDLYILFEDGKRKYDISTFDTLVGKYVYITDNEKKSLYFYLTESQYIYLEEGGNNYIEFIIGFPVEDFYSFKIIDVAPDFDRATTIATMGDINPTTLNAEFDNIKDYVYLIQEILSKKALRMDAEYDDTMLPKLSDGEIWSMGTDGLEASDISELSYDDSAIQAEVDLNTAKETNINHPLVETAVPSGALFTDTIYDDSDVLKDSDTVSPVTAINKLITEDDITGGEGDMTKAEYDTNDNGIVDNSEKVNNLTVLTAVPSGALFTDTIYDSTDVDTHMADTTGNPHEVSLEQARTKSNILNGLVNFNNNSIANLADLNFNDGETVTWNTKYNTLNIPNGDGTIGKACIDTIFRVHNNTGTTLTKGTVVYPTGTSTGGVSNVDRAIARTHETLESVIGLISHDILNGENGSVMVSGVLDPINTVGLTAGLVYLSGEVAGTLTNEKPDWTRWTVLVGVVDEVSATGVITVDIAFNIQDTITNFFNGIFRESFDFNVTATGGVITGTLTPTDDNTDMTIIFNDGMYLLDTSPPATIVLTAGTDTVPQMNYVYIPNTTKVLTVSTSGFPVDVELVRVGEILVQSATTVEANGALKNHNFNDHVQGTTGQGHMSHITARLRVFDASWEAGTEASITGLPTNAYVSITGGSVYQLHLQSVPSLVMPTDNANVVNDFTTSYNSTTDLLTILNDAEGNALLNSSFSLVVWGVANKTGEPSHIMVNLPTDSYLQGQPQDAVDDANGYSVYSIPKEFRGVGFLIARFTFINASGTWTLYDTEDLRGKFANTTAGGGGTGGGGTGATTLLGLTDTPSAYGTHSLDIARVNSGETALEFTPLTASLVTDFDTEVANNTAVTANTAKVSNVDHPLVETAVPVGALFTDTIYDDSDVLKDADALTPVTGINKLITQDDIGALGGGDMLKSVYDTGNNGIVDNSELVNSLTVETAVPSGALFTDTIYDDTAIQAEVDLNTAKVTNVDHPLVETAVPVGAVFTDTVYDDTAIQAEVDLNTAKVTNVAHPLVETAVPTGALFTDTQYIPAGGNADEVLAKATGTDYDLEWVVGGSGTITSVPMEYCRAKVSTNQTLNTTGNTDMVFSTADENSNAAKFTVVSGGIQVLQSGRYNVRLQHSLTSPSTQRSDPTLEILLNTVGSGYLTREHYGRGTTSIDDSTASVSIIMDLTADDIIGMRLTRGNIDLTAVVTYGADSWIEITEYHGVKGDKGDTGATGEVPEAPNDGVAYGRESEAWTPVLTASANLVEIVILTQAQYDALGAAPNTDNKLYIIRS